MIKKISNFTNTAGNFYVNTVYLFDFVATRYNNMNMFILLCSHATLLQGLSTSENIGVNECNN